MGGVLTGDHEGERLLVHRLTRTRHPSIPRLLRSAPPCYPCAWSAYDRSIAPAGRLPQPPMPVQSHLLAVWAVAAPVSCGPRRTCICGTILANNRRPDQQNWPIVTDRQHLCQVDVLPCGRRRERRARRRCCSASEPETAPVRGDRRDRASAGRPPPAQWLRDVAARSCSGTKPLSGWSIRGQSRTSWDTFAPLRTGTAMSRSALEHVLYAGETLIRCPVTVARRCSADQG